MIYFSASRKASSLSLDNLERKNLWKSMRCRIGKRFLGLDSAGNICFFYSYKRAAPGAWGPVTICDLQTPDATKAGGFALLVDRHPMHTKCIPLLEKHLSNLREKQIAIEKDWSDVLKRRHEEIIAGFENEDTPQKDVSGSSLKSSPMPDAPSPINFRFEMNKALRSKKICRLNRIITALYKSVYFCILMFFGFITVYFYKLFKRWLNPPARQGLVNIEDYFFYYPRRARDFLDDTIIFPLIDFIEDDRELDNAAFTSFRGAVKSFFFFLEDTYNSFLTVSFDVTVTKSLETTKIPDAVIEKRKPAQIRELFAFLFLLFFVLVVL